VPKPFPPEFRRDVIAVARKGEAAMAQLARDFGISESCLARWLKIADREDGISGPASSDRGGDEKSDAAELRELRRRNGLLKQRSEILRRATAYFAREQYRAASSCGRGSPCGSEQGVLLRPARHVPIQAVGQSPSGQGLPPVLLQQVPGPVAGEVKCADTKPFILRFDCGLVCWR
jgi:transposase